MKFKIYVKDGFGELKGLLAPILEGSLPADRELIYDGPRNKLYRIKTRFGAMILKCFKVPGAVNSVVYTTLRKSKARRSYINSQRLIDMGFRAPEPVAWGEAVSGCKLHRSFYLCREVEGDTIRFYERRPDCRAMLEALAAEMLKMHRAGVWHKDFSPGNALVSLDAEGRYSFNYVDLNRMAFGVKSRGKLMRMFERVNDDEEQTLRLARAYAQVASEPSESVEAQARKAYREFHKRVERKKRLKRLLRGRKAGK
jgi:tRNA A-37 threonylcarbamoyl transferase component Bud32